MVAALAAGRTSIVADPSFEREFYRIGGFRYLGKRAVRIDILERLADFIRPTLAWKPGNGPRPAGGYDGERFMVTPAMLSILGATPADMEEILKGLGYRADTVPAEEADKKVADIDASVAAAQPKPDTPEVIVERVVRHEPKAGTDETTAEAAAPAEGETLAEPGSAESHAFVEARQVRAAPAGRAQPKQPPWRFPASPEP